MQNVETKFYAEKYGTAFWLIRTAFAFMLIAGFSGCAGIRENWLPKAMSPEERAVKDKQDIADRQEAELVRVSAVSLQPSREPVEPSSVKIFTGKPSERYVELAVLTIEGRGPSSGLLSSPPEAFDDLASILKRKAGRIGANALMELVFGDVEIGTRSFSSAAGNEYSNRVNVDTVSRKKYKRVVKAVAVRIE